MWFCLSFSLGFDYWVCRHNVWGIEFTSWLPDFFILLEKSLEILFLLDNKRNFEDLWWIHSSLIIKFSSFGFLNRIISQTHHWLELQTSNSRQLRTTGCEKKHIFRYQGTQLIFLKYSTTGEICFFIQAFFIKYLEISAFNYGFCVFGHFKIDFFYFSI